MRSAGTLSLTAALLAAAASAPAPLVAQSLTSQLSNLLVVQADGSTTTPAEVAAAGLTRDAVAGLVAVELATLPVASSSGGFAYRLNRQLGVVERASDSFGPFYTESVLRPGAAQTGLGVRYQQSRFSSLQGNDLTRGTFPTTATRLVGSATPFSVDALELTIDTRTVAIIGTHGLSDRWSVGGVVPLQTVSVSGRRTRDSNGIRALQSAENGRRSGLGDIALQTRYRLVDRGNAGLSLGADLRLPTGRAEDLLGAGKTGGRLLAVTSVDEGRLALHANGSAGLGGISRDVIYGVATTFAASPRLTLVSEFMGRWVAGLTRLEDVYQPSPGVAGTETMRWLPVERGLHASFAVVGAKWNVARSVLVNANLLIRVSESGLRAPLTPMVSLDWDIQR